MGNKLRKYIFTFLITISSFLIGIGYVNATGNPGEIILNKTAVKDDLTEGRDADISLTIDANSFSTVGRKDVVLVLDRSSSMNGTKMSDTKDAAKGLVDILITPSTSSMVRVAVVTYGTDVINSTALSNNASSLKSTINNIQNNINGQGTNVHAGLKKAAELLSSSSATTSKIVILLSDGEPTFFIGNDNSTVCGSGSSDSLGFYDDVSICTVNGNSRPSTVANSYATEMKTNGIEMFTVGFDVSSSSSAYSFLGNVATDPDSTHLYLASNYSNLSTVFANMVNNFSTVATGGIVTDIIPAGFHLVPGTLSQAVTVTENPVDGTTTITWNVGNISSLITKTLTYKIEADENQYGSMYTNVVATLNATAIDGNPEYSESSISIDFTKPVVSIPPITEDDNYTSNDTYYVYEGQSNTINALNGILVNDSMDIKNTDNGATVTNAIRVSAGTGALSNITVNNDGSFTYNAPSGQYGDVTYIYHIETTVTIGANTTIVNSNSSTITIRVVRPVSYTVNYYIKDTITPLATSKPGTGYVNKNVTENALSINGYTLYGNSSQTIVLQETGNVINFYYTANPQTYTVNHYKRGTTDVLHSTNGPISTTYGSTINPLDLDIEIEGYTYNTATPNPFVVGSNNAANVINLYYIPRTDLSYTVNYYKDSVVTANLIDSDTFNNQTYLDTIESSEVTLDAYKPTGYKSGVIQTSMPITIQVSGNVINVLYEKRTDLSYTVNYLEQGSNLILHTEKVVNGKTFNSVVTENAISINGYKKVNPTSKTITITTGTNEITFYYKKRADLGYMVLYLEKGTNLPIYLPKIVTGQTFNSVIAESARNIDGYTKVAPTTQNLTITTGLNVLTFYYEKRTDLSYTVKYLEQGTNNSIADDKLVTGQTYLSLVCESAINVNGYTKVNPTHKSIIITTGTNEITFYYKKRTDLSYTVKYLEQGTNKVLSTNKLVINQTFGNNVTENAIDINGYIKVNPTSANIEITTGINEAVFYYTLSEQTYTVNHYVLGTTDKVVPSETKTVLFSTVITSINEKKDNIEGYTFNSLSPATLTITTNNETNVINIYYVAVNGTVKVMYTDNKGNLILDTLVLTGRVGTEYSTTSKEIAKYKLLRVDGIESGKYINGELVVTYVYEAIPNTGLYTNDMSIYIPIISMLSLAGVLLLKKKVYNK